MNLKVIDPARLYSLNEFRQFVPGGGRTARVSISTLYRWILGGKLKGRKVGERWTVTGATILQFLHVKDAQAMPLDFETAAQESRRVALATAALKAKWERKPRAKS